MLKGKKLLTVILSVLFVLSMGTLVACGGDDGACNFATEWSSDATNHWYACTDSGCKEVDQLAEHVWDNGTVKVAATCDTVGETEYKCKTCGYAKTEEVAALGHSFATTYTTDADGHWFACTRGCGAKGDYTEHVWNDGELLQEIVGTGKGEAIYACTVCGHDARNYIVNVTLVDMDGSLGGGFAEDKVIVARVNGPKKISAVQERGPEYELVGYYTNPAYDTMVVDAEGNFVDCEYVEDGRWISEEGQTLYAKWKKADKIYRVKFYVQGINNDKFLYQANETITMKGYIGDMTAAVAPEREGFTALPFDQVLIEEGGRTSVDIYYQRNSYTVSFSDAGAESNPAPQILKYGAKIAPVANGAKDGFEFDGWYLNGEKFNISRDTVPAKDVTLVAKYSVYLGNAGQYELYKGIANGKPVANGDFTTNVAGLGEFESVEVRANGNDFVLVEGEDYTLENGVFTLKADTIKKGVYGDIAIKFTTGEDFYYVNASIATKFIRTVADLENLMIYGDVDENLNYGGYFMLANNIEVNGVLANRVRTVNYTYLRSNGTAQGGWHDTSMLEGFTGTFDGKGYTIFGLQASATEGALFGNVSKDAIVKNLGIAEAKLVPNGDFFGIFGNDFAGKLDNCYIDVAISATTSAPNIGALARSVAGATISNTVIKFNADNHSGAGKKFGYAYMINNWPGYATDKVVSNNVYMFVTDGVSIGGYASANADGIYWADISAITVYAYDEVVGGVSVYDSAYWNFNGDQPKFKSAGAADVSRDYVGEAYQADAYEVYADVVDGELVGNDFVIDLTDTLGDFDASAVTSVTFSAGANKVTTTNFSFDAGILTVNGAEIGAKIYGDVVVVLNTKDVNYRISSFKMITKYVSTKADLDNLFVYGNVDKASADKNYDGYFVMTSNIEVNGELANRNADNVAMVALDNKTATANSTLNKGFVGTFDGNGYTIYGLTVNSNVGLFGNVAKAAVVKNIGFEGAIINQTASLGANFLLAEEFAGTLTNAYISIDFTGDVSVYGTAAVARNATDAQVTDLVIKYNVSAFKGQNLIAIGTMINNWANYWDAKTNIKNVYVFADANVYAGEYGARRGDGSYYVKVSNFNVYGYNDVVDGISFADDSMWNFSGDQPKFATAGAADYTVAYIGSSYQTTPLYVYNSDNSTNNFVVDLTGNIEANGIDVADISTIEVVGQNGTKLSVEPDALVDGILTVAGSDLGVSIYGDVRVIIYTSTVNYKISSFKVITKVLTTRDDIVNIHQFGGATAGNYSYDGYYELGNNIDVAGMKITETYLKTAAQWEWDVDKWNQGFKGILDGKGYVISNIPAFSCYSPGIFGVVEQGGVIRNTGFTGSLEIAPGGSPLYTAMIVLANRGTIENCYAEATITKVGSAPDTARAGVVGRNYGTINDLVVKYDASLMTKAAQITAIGKFSAPVTNVYVYYKHADGLTPATYAGVTNLAWNDKTTEIALSDTTYWNLDGDQPQFLSMGAANVTVETGTSSFEAVSGLDGDNVVYNDLVLNYGADIDAAKIKGVAIKTASGEVAITDYTYNAGILTISGSALTKVYGVANVSIKTETVNYNSNDITVITKVIENQADLENMPIYGGIDTASVGKTYGGYFALADNLELTSALAKRVAGTDYRNGGATDNAIEDRGGKVANDGMNGFTGIFDGQGYTISGLEVKKDNGGLFGNIATTATVKNLGVVAKFVETGWGYVFGNQVTGVIDNVYVETSFAAGLGEGGYFAIARNVSTSKLSNIVIKYDTANAPAKNNATIAFMTGDWYGWNVHAGSMTNVYTISAGIGSKGYTGTVTPTTEFGYSDVIADLTLADKTFWNFAGDQPKFATAGKAEKFVAMNSSVEIYSGFENGAPVAGKVELPLNATEVKSVTVASTPVEYDFADGVITISAEALSAYAGSEAVVVVETADVVYTFTKINVITKIIKNQADLENMFIYGGLDSNLNYGGYFVLGNNITLTSKLANRVGDVDYRAYSGTNTIENASETRDGRVPNNRNQGFTGVFDGQGYTISGLVVGLKNGNIFGNVAENGGEVKNLAVIGKFDAAEFTDGGAAGLLANQFCGKLTNCYLEYSFTAATAKGSFGAIARNISNAKVTDVVIKVDKNGSTAGDIFSLAFMGVDHIGWQSGTAAINNVHSISAGAAVMSSGYSVNATVEENTIEHDVDVAFSFAPASTAYWDLTGTQPIFASAK